MLRPLPLGTALAASLLLCACGPKVWRGEVVVSLDPSLRDQAGRWPVLEVDLIGTGAGDAARWQALPVTAYFEPGSQARAGAPRVTIWFDGDHPVGTLRKDDVVWDGWKKQGADTLVVYADLLAVERPAPIAGAPPAAPANDDRRLVLSLYEDKVPLDRNGRLMLLATARGIVPQSADRDGATGAKGGTPQTRTAGLDDDGRVDDAKASPIRRAGTDDQGTPPPRNEGPGRGNRRNEER